jgi:hypothetical protein
MVEESMKERTAINFDEINGCFYDGFLQINDLVYERPFDVNFR